MDQWLGKWQCWKRFLHHLKDTSMPSTSPAQARLMAAVAHGWQKPGGGGPPVSVAKEFNQADAAKHKRKALAKAIRGK